MSLITRRLGSTLALLCSLSLCSSATQQQNRQQFEREFAENATLPKIHCHQREAKQATCIISKFDYSCNITVRAMNGTVGRAARAVPLGKDRAIVIWLEKTSNTKFLKFHVLGLSTCESRSLVEAKLAIGDEDDSYLEWAVSASTYEASFDVFYVAEDRHKYCKQSVDIESGQTIGKLICLDNNYAPPFYTSYFPIEPYTSSRPKGYVLLLPSFRRTIDAWFVGPSDEVVQFAKFSRDLPVGRFAVSTTHNTISICQQQRLDLAGNATLVNCTRFDIFDGSRKQQTQLKLVDGAKVSDVFNLSDGGYLLALSKRSPLGCDDAAGADAERLMKVSRENVTFFAINRENLDCDCASLHLRTRMFENERREYCLATLCSVNRHSLANAVRTQCFSDRELAVKTFTV